MFGIFSLLVFGAVAAAAGYMYMQIPSEKQIKGCMVTTMYQVNLCPGSKDYVPLKQISKYVQQAIVLTEDSSFFDHDGFDWKSIEENAKKNLEKGVYAKGGSTISQQLAKNLFLYKDKTLIRKGLEALITQKIEKTLSKKEILERYLNVVEFGNEVYGVKQAAIFYFKKSPASLTIVESAFLAMVLPNPKKYSQSYFKKELTPFAHKRLKKIVGDMHQYGRINDEEFDLASNQIAGFFSLTLLSDDYGISEIGDDNAATAEQEIQGTTLDELENLDAGENSEL
ncbi:MAG: monofunctional biosynthetic peptidoglycan transglycosylase [Bdellovibrionaceae bacterium]|nr:monofunctional biosynthetic peptidoglycan transglycosylase [Pseudobdellovibrionaceae bacterium]